MKMFSNTWFIDICLENGLIFQGFLTVLQLPGGRPWLIGHAKLNKFFVGTTVLSLPLDEKDKQCV
jgi:hypothetical protein